MHCDYNSSLINKEIQTSEVTVTESLEEGKNCSRASIICKLVAHGSA